MLLNYLSLFVLGVFIMYLEELQTFYLAHLFRTYTVGLVLGSSTMALVFYLYVVAKGKTEPAENRMMHIIYSVLRVGMVLVLVSEFTCFLYNYHIDNFVYWTDNPELLMRLTIYSIIVVNAFAMQFRKISFWIGPVIAAGSWYAYFFFSTWIETESTYPVLFVGYLIWLSIVFVIVNGIRLFLTRNQKNRIGDGSDAVKSNKTAMANSAVSSA